MKTKTLNPEQSLNSNYLLEIINTVDFNNLKVRLKELIDQVNNGLKKNQIEEHFKNNLKEFLSNTFYKDKYSINTKAYIGQHGADLVIRDSKDKDSKVNVLFEIKAPGNSNEMISINDINKKALHEAIQYYLWEKIKFNNNELKHIIVTNIFQWFIFDAVVFHDLFYKNKELLKQFEQWHDKMTDSHSTIQMYEFIERLIENSTEEIKFTYIDLNSYDFVQDSSQLFQEQIEVLDSDIEIIYKLLSPKHLLKKFTFDSNSLNEPFYNELLYLIGLEEVSEGSKKKIQRKKNAHSGTLIENTINKLKTLGKVDDNIDILFEKALLLCILWINRILFLKLLETQLVIYHCGDEEYFFMKSSKLKEFDELETLFFEVLAVKPSERNPNLIEKYSNIPYLNSSLFEVSKLEKDMITISNLKDHISIPVYSGTVLKDSPGNKKKNTEINFLTYLLDFLDAYNFGYVGKALVQDDKKDLINASVLGLVFEKINGYKEGSFFTPGTITEYMSREALRMSVVRKFQEKYGWKIDFFKDIKNYLDDKRSSKILEYNDVINSLRICDPAVGSGHFLVSCMNEIIAIKSELGIIADENGDISKIQNYDFIVESDTLFIKNKNDGHFFEYTVNTEGTYPGAQRIISPDKQFVQKALFHEKKTIIENCLFGVDINENSVNIARLRLWIELLKNAYYTEESNFTELDTLPNIDINIKCGNSLISRYSLARSMQFTLKDERVISEYKKKVKEYKNTSNKTRKNNLKNGIENDKRLLSGGLLEKSDKKLQLDILVRTFTEKFGGSQTLGVELNIKDEKKYNKEREDLNNKIAKLSEELAEEENMKKTAYIQAFEWRYEFPEVLDDSGDFIGFDVVIGNPPYIQMQKEGGKLSDLIKLQNYSTFARTGDIYTIFIENGINILKENGYLTYITSNKWMRAGYGELLRDFLANRTSPLILIDFGGYKVFDSATVDTNILIVGQTPPSDTDTPTLSETTPPFYACTIGSDFNMEIPIHNYFDTHKQFMPKISKNSWVIDSSIEQRIKEKIEAIGTPLKEWEININRGILTGLNEAFIISGKKKDELIAEDYKSEEVIKPILRGRDIKKYKAEFADLWLINIPKGFTIKNMQSERKNIISEPMPRYGYEEYDEAWEWIKHRFTAISYHLLIYKSKAKKRQDQGDYWWELRACAYLEEFEKEKIIYPNMTKFLPFVYDNSKIFANPKCYILAGESLKYLTAALNSKISSYWIRENCPELLGGTRELQKRVMELLPIVKIVPEEQKPFIELVDTILKKKESNINTNTEEKEIDRLVYKLYDLTEEEIRVVEGK